VSYGLLICQKRWKPIRNRNIEGDGKKRKRKKKTTRGGNYLMTLFDKES
jgi:hypothetical protein